MNSILTAFVNAALISTPLAALIWIALRLTSPRILRAAARYVIWWVALAVTITLPVAYLRAHPSAAHRAASAVRVAAPAEAPPEFAAPPDAPDAVRRAIPTPTAKPPHFPLQIPAGRWIAWISTAWALTATLLLLRLAVSCALLSGRKARARGIPAAFPAGTGRSIRMAVSEEVSAPMAAGVLHPTILIPARLIRELDASELDLIGLHEAAHFARRDDYALIVERLIEALFALHPVVRWIARQIDLEREIACDDRVVEATGRPLPYAACLTRVAELTGGVRAPFSAAAATMEGSHLARRVEMLLDKTRRTGTRWLRTQLACALAVVAALAWMTARTPALLAFTTPPAVVTPARSAPPVPAVAIAQSPAPPKPAPRLIAQAAPPQAPAPQTAPVRVVLANGTVTDREGRRVIGLKQENFRITEDGVEQQISYFRTDEVPGSLGVVSLNPNGVTLAIQEELVQVQQLVPKRVEFIEAANPKLSVDDAATAAIGRMRQTPHPMLRFVLLLDAPSTSSEITQYDEGEARVISAPPGVTPQNIAPFLRGNYYVLGYNRTNFSTDGKDRQIKVSLSGVQGLPQLRPYFRDRYSASEKPIQCQALPDLPPNAMCY